MIWTDRYGHVWDLDTKSPCRRCGQEKPGRFDSMCRGVRDTAEPVDPLRVVSDNARKRPC